MAQHNTFYRLDVPQIMREDRVLCVLQYRVESKTKQKLLLGSACGAGLNGAKEGEFRINGASSNR